MKSNITKHKGVTPTGARVIVISRKLGGDKKNFALVVYEDNLPDYIRNKLMTFVDNEGQQYADLLMHMNEIIVDENVDMFNYLHTKRLLSVVATNKIIMRITPTQSMPLSELNEFFEQEELKKQEVEVEIDTSNPLAAKQADDNREVLNESVGEQNDVHESTLMTAEQRIKQATRQIDVAKHLLSTATQMDDNCDISEFSKSFEELQVVLQNITK